MADVTIHDIDPEVLKKLEEQAHAQGRSVEEEICAMIGAQLPLSSIEETRRIARKWQEHFRGRFFSDSTDLIREDRER